MSDYAIRVRDLGLRFLIRHQKAPTVHSGLVRFLKRGGKPEEFWALRNITLGGRAATPLLVRTPLQIFWIAALWWSAAR